MQGAFDELLLTCKPKVPALNRWTQLFPPLAWWMACCLVHSVGRKAFLLLRGQEGSAHEVAQSVIELGGPDNDATYRATQAARWRKALAWLSDGSNIVRLVLTGSAMLPALDIIGALFMASKQKVKRD